MILRDEVIDGQSVLADVTIDKSIAYTYLVSSVFGVLGTLMVLLLLMNSYDLINMIFVIVALTGGGIPSFILGAFLSSSLLEKFYKVKN